MTNHPTSDERPERVDRLLGDYFKAQLPTKWPAAPRPDRARPATTRTSPAARSRWALAASVAVLVGGCWYLSGHSGAGKRGVGLEGGTATHPKEVLKDLEKPKAGPRVGMP
jgi:hypothetical protein